MAKRSFLDGIKEQAARAGREIGQTISDELAAAPRDIRQKVVEEGWFGRQTTPEPVVPVRDSEQGNVWGRHHSDMEAGQDREQTSTREQNDDELGY